MASQPTPPRCRRHYRHHADGHRRGHPARELGQRLHDRGEHAEYHVQLHRHDLRRAELRRGRPNHPTGYTDGYAPGNYSGTTISSTGALVSTYSNGQTVTHVAGTLAIANFINQEGLTSLSGNLYAASTSRASR